MIKELTKQEAIRLHRELWNKIADMTEELSEPVSKGLALQALGYPTLSGESGKYCYPRGYCWCCEYAAMKSGSTEYYCHKCPIDWGQECIDLACIAGDSPFNIWDHACSKLDTSGDLLSKDLKNDLLATIILAARQIAALPEREDQNG